MMIDSINADEDNVILLNKTEQDLIQFMTDWGNISGRRDAVTLDQMLADDLIMTMADGTLLTKTEYLDGFKHLPNDFGITDYDQQVQIFPHTAIVRARYIFEMNGSKMPLRYTATFIKRREKWEAVAFHSSPLASG